MTHRTSLRTLLAVAISMVAGLLVMPPSSGVRATDAAPPVEVAENLPTRYLVELAPGEVPVAGKLDDPDIDQIARDAAAESVKADVESVGGEVIADLGESNFLVVDVDDPSVLADAEGVEAFEPQISMSLLLDSSLEVVKASDQYLQDALGGMPADGSGTIVAVVDTGISANHPFFSMNGQSKVVLEACFTDFSCPGGGQFAEGSGSAAVNGAGSHGTHVAGIAAGVPRVVGGVTLRGVAQGSELAAVQIFDSDGYTDSAKIVQALDWLLQKKREGHNIVAVNLSVGSVSQYFGTCDTNFPITKDLVDQLADAGVVVVAASGNDDSRIGMVSPACLSNVVPVLSVSDGLVVSGFSNVGIDAPTRGLAAPGESITSSFGGTSYWTLSGTSMAAPHVAGAAAVLKQANPSLNTAQLKEALRNSLTLIDDTRSSGVVQDVPLLDMCAAIAASRQDLGSVSGTLTRSFDGVTSPLADASVSAFFIPAGVREGRTTVSAVVTTDAQGRFISPLLETGVWSVKLADLHFAAETQPFCLSSGWEPSVSATMTTSSGELMGAIRLDSTSLPIGVTSVTVAATPVGDLYGRVTDEQMFTTSTAGLFGPMALRAGIWDITVSGNGFQSVVITSQTISPGETLSIDVRISPVTRIEILYGLLGFGGTHAPPAPPVEGGWYGIGWQVVNAPNRYGFRYKSISTSVAGTLQEFLNAPFSSSTANDCCDGSQGVPRWETNGILEFNTPYRFMVQVVDTSGEVVASSEVVEFNTLAEGQVIEDGLSNRPAFLGLNPYAPGGLFSISPPAPVVDSNQGQGAVSTSASSIVIALSQASVSAVSGWQYSTDDGGTWASALARIVEFGPTTRTQVTIAQPSSASTQAVSALSSGLQPGTQYQVRLRAINGQLAGPSGAAISVTMPGTLVREEPPPDTNPVTTPTPIPPGGGGGGGGGGGAPSPATQQVTPGSGGSTVVQLGLAFGTVRLNFADLAGPGSVTVTPKAGLPPFNSGGVVLPGYWLDITTSTGSFGSVEVCAPIETQNLSSLGLSVGQLRLFHWENNVRKDVTTRVDTANNRICGTAKSFSPFAVGALRTQRVAGEDRYETAAELSAASFTPGVAVAYVVTGEKFPDALAAGAAAGREGGPVLLALFNSLPSVTVNELKRVAPRRVIVVGGTAVISDAVLASIRSALPGVPVERIAGEDRFETAAKLSQRTFTATNGTVYLGSGLGFTEILAGSAAAGRDKSPLLLVPGTGPNTGLPLTVATELKRLNPRTVVILGGSGLVASSVVDAVRRIVPNASIDQIGGVDAYDTAAKVARRFVSGGTVYVATGAVFADGLAGGAAAATRGHPMVMVPSSGTLPIPVAQALTQLRPARIIVLGGTAAIARDIENAVAGYMP